MAKKDATEAPPAEWVPMTILISLPEGRESYVADMVVHYNASSKGHYAFRHPDQSAMPARNVVATAEGSSVLISAEVGLPVAAPVKKARGARKAGTT